MTDEEHKTSARGPRAATKAEKAEQAEEAEPAEPAEQPLVALSYAEMERLRARLTRKYH